MRVLIAPDSFKGSLSALEAARCMERGVLAVFPEAVCDTVPMADGGEGTVDALVNATEGTLFRCHAAGPLGTPVDAVWGMLGRRRSDDVPTAVVEMAAASGLPLLSPEERDPLRACTYGTGEVIRAALSTLHASRDSGKRPRLIIGIGGSATNDGGAGAIRALGARFLDAAGEALPPGGAALARLAGIDLTGLDPLLKKTDILVACDVDNPLTGPRGASAIFGPQKGAGPVMVEELDSALGHFARIAREATGRDVAGRPGAGAAGGLGAGLLFFTNAEMTPGVQLVLEAVGFDERAAKADLVLTGEGRTDAQTAFGKTPAGVAMAAKRHGKPVVCISGALAQGAESLNIEGVDVLTAAVCAVGGLEYCMENAGRLLESASERVCRLLGIGMRI